MHNNGKEYELFVADLQQALLNAENITLQKNIKVEVNKIITDNCNIDRQFDIYWEYELGGLIYKTVIECKDYNSNVSIEKIDALIGKTRDIPDLKAVFATKKGYQSGAQIKATQNKIDLLIVREQNETDWQDKNGEPYIKSICINMHINVPPQIRNFVPKIDAEWLKTNTDIDPSKPIQLYGLNNEIYVEDVNKNERYSLYELAHKLKATQNEQYGIFTKKEKFENAFIYYKDLKLKISEYDIEYSIAPPLIEPIEIDFSKELVGVIEYLQRGTKSSIFKNGIIRQEER